MIAPMVNISTSKKRSTDNFADARDAWQRSRETCEQLTVQTVRSLNNIVTAGEQLKRLTDQKEELAVAIRTEISEVKNAITYLANLEQVTQDAVKLFWKTIATSAQATIWQHRELIFLVTEALPELNIDNHKEWVKKVKDSLLKILDSPDNFSHRERWESFVTIIQEGYDEIRDRLRAKRPLWNLSFFDERDEENEELETNDETTLSQLKSLLDSLESEFELRLKERERLFRRRRTPRRMDP
jgi:flagellar motility protein MotE (MotC chaperone)